MKRILSLGAGVQSSVLLMLSEKNQIPRFDAAIFADTRWEPKEVYRHLEWLKANTSIPIHVVSVGDLRADAIHYQRFHTHSGNGLYAAIPLYVRNPDGTDGMIRRQCTERYKIRPIAKKVRELVGLAKGARSSEILSEQWIGISFDERTRMKDPLYPWIRNVYWLVDNHWSRSKCLDWWSKNYNTELPRSACLGCPFHSNQEWQRLKTQDPEGFQDAVQFEQVIQAAQQQDGEVLKGTPYLHAKRRPLNTINFDREKGQGSLWDNECSGVCGV